MALGHTAFAFDWAAFASDLLPLLTRVLVGDTTDELAACIDRHCGSLADPYEGRPLTAGWRDRLENRDVHEYGDSALTRFYDTAGPRGVGYAWADLTDVLPGEVVGTLLGFPIGPDHGPFDPGRCGSYFQRPEHARRNGGVLLGYARPELADYLALLDRCGTEDCGIYVTF